MGFDGFMRKTANELQQAAADFIREFDDDAGDAVDKVITKTRNTIESMMNPLEQAERKKLFDPVGFIWDELQLPRASREEPVSKEDCRLADHLFRDGSGIGQDMYTHHAIYIGSGQVMHYAGQVPDIYIQVADFEEFAEGYQVYRYTEQASALLFSREEAVSRAWQRCGEQEYHLIHNNCENFVRWCRAGTDTY